MKLYYTWKNNLTALESIFGNLRDNDGLHNPLRRLAIPWRKRGMGGSLRFPWSYCIMLIQCYFPNVGKSPQSCKLVDPHAFSTESFCINIFFHHPSPTHFDFPRHVVSGHLEKGRGDFRKDPWNPRDVLGIFFESPLKSETWEIKSPGNMFSFTKR